MAYKVIILYRLYMPSYVLGTFTEYPFLRILYLCYAVFLCNQLLRTYFTGVRVKQSKSGDQLNRLPILITLYPFCKFTVNVV